jgi:hypothetical protein
MHRAPLAHRNWSNRQAMPVQPSSSFPLRQSKYPSHFFSGGTHGSATLPFVFTPVALPGRPQWMSSVWHLRNAVKYEKICWDEKSILCKSYQLTALGFITSIDTIHDHITLLMRRYTICLIEYVLTAAELSIVAVGRWTWLKFILALLTILLIIAHPKCRYTFAIGATELSA